MSQLAKEINLWQSTSDPQLLVDELVKKPMEHNSTWISGWATSRQLRLFCLAACQAMAPVWKQREPPHRDRVVKKLFALVENWIAGGPFPSQRNMGGYSYYLLDKSAGHAARMASIECKYSHFTKDFSAQIAALVRDIIGNPFNPVFQQKDYLNAHVHGVVLTLANEKRINFIGQNFIDQSCLTWNDGFIVKLSESIYRNQRFEDMQILGDALEDAGCNNEEILRHCHGQELGVCSRCSTDVDHGKCVVCKGTGFAGWRPLRGHHVRGCWVLDLLRGERHTAHAVTLWGRSVLGQSVAGPDDLEDG